MACMLYCRTCFCALGWICTTVLLINRSCSASPVAAGSDVDDLSVGDLYVDDLSVDDLSVDDLSVDDLSVVDLFVDRDMSTREMFLTQTDFSSAAYGMCQR